MRNRTVGVEVLKTAFSVLLVAFVSGCSSEPEIPANTVRDSSGVEIVESTRPIWEPGDEWRLGEVLTAIGELEGDEEYQLFRAFSAFRNSRGEIVVGNVGSHEIRFYDETGTFIRSVGSEGEGPGEFSNRFFIHRLSGDSILVWDGGQMRTSVFSPSGEFLDGANMSGTGQFLNLTGVLADGRFVMSPNTVFGSGSTEEGLSRNTRGYFLADRSGDSLGEIGVFRGSEFFVKTFGTGGISVSSILLGKQTVAAVQGAHLFVGTGDDFTIHAMDEEGGTTRLIRRMVPQVAIGPEMWEQAKVSYLEGMDDRFRQSQEDMVEAMPVPDFLPTFTRLKTDVVGNLWVAGYDAMGELANVWSVFGTDGRWLGEVSLPEGFTMVDIGRDYILGRVTDDMDVEHLVLRELLKGPAASGSSNER